MCKHLICIKVGFPPDLLYFKLYSMITIEELKKEWGWFYINGGGLSRSNISGWKLHIFGDTLEDSVLVGNAIEPVLKQYDVTAKIATKIILMAGIGVESDPQYGKVATLYLPAKLFKEGKSADFVKDIQAALISASYTKTGNISGDAHLEGSVYYRYELDKMVDPTIGAHFEEYHRHYRANDGEYNIEGNPDIKQTLLNQ